MTSAAPPEPPTARVGLSRDSAGRPVPSAWQRARSRIRGEDPVIGWAGGIAVAVLALFLRLWHLGKPHAFEFDETYYAKDAWSLLHFGYARDWVEKANDHILDGQTADQWKSSPEMIVHPEVGKWLIALGEKAFGMDPFGWRVSAAVIGALMVLVMCRLARRLTGSTLLGCIAGLLLCFDGLHFVLSRLALLDIFVAFFILCGVHCVVADRDWHRARMARLVPEDSGGRGSWGPVRGLLVRPWLLVGGVCWGLAVGTKWEALYPLAAFGLLVWLWSAGARRSFGVRASVLRSAVVDGVPAFVQLVLVALVVYVASWTGWLIHADTYEEHLSATQYTHHGGGADWPTRTEPDASGIGEVTQSLRSLWYYHQDVYAFHTHFLNDSTHTYASKPLGWLLLNRPVGVSADTDIQPGTQGCEAPTGSDCLRQVLLLGSPAVWWGGCLAILYALAMWVGARDWRFGVAVVGTLSTWLPWLQYDDRPIFSFYAVITLPFLVLALTLAIGRMLGTSSAPSGRRTAGVVVSGAYLVLVLMNFAWFWPIWTDQLLTHGEWLDRIWFTRWI
ncbi:phospholipid carrier-dependent glycosyltransferase [Nocardioides sp. YIM 152315]|uniref:dolichyl-phosphate-mannose--protein mannosyltransferase n=1 Tax=Nocardioides sp. YIM 152315 TaxID=3031760 RepID=UPI0023DBFBC0|nr:phospholipid carrier-dependent glycosyltransferase [Nocardioides sp. YIM 152315]MDF1605740.1 phospholipid carrier-dependent glycosyltransferase [Nocardioides sp. YIM 152315]